MKTMTSAFGPGPTNQTKRSGLQVASQICKGFLAVFLLFTFSALEGQTTLHLDKPYYLAGENIFFAFCNRTIESDSVTARVRLFNNSRLVDSYFVPVLNQCGEGHLKLPYQSETGNYAIDLTLFCGEDLRPAVLANVRVTVYNDGDRASLGDQKLAEIPIGQTQNIDVITASASNRVSYRYAIPAEFADRIARVSVAVRDQGIYGSKKNTVHLDEPLVSLEEASWGIPFYGKRVNSEESQIRNPLLFALNAENLHFDATEVNLENKEFKIPMTPFYGSKAINFLDYLDDSVKVQQAPARPRPVVPGAYEVDSLVLQHLDIYQEEKTINQAFQQIGLQVKQDSTDLLKVPMPPNYVADVQDFAIRGTTVTLFKELITPLKFRSLGKDRYRARMLYERNNIKKYYTKPPLFIVNGRATRDGPYIGSFPLQEIGYFRIYSLYDDLESISPMAFGGIVFVDMLDPNYVLSDSYAQPSYKVRGLQLPVVYPVGPKISDEAPAVGTLLYWNPQVEIVDGALQCNMNTMDVASEYLIEVVLHLKDQDAPVIHHELLRVENAQN